jgi:hypothetical protein
MHQRTKGKISFMANSAPVSIQELLVSSLAQSDALAKLLIEKGVVTQQEFLDRIAEERAIYQRLLNTVAH